MYAANTAVVPDNTALETKSSEEVYGGTLFTDATIFGSELSYFMGENALSGKNISGLDIGLSFRIPISIGRVTIFPFIGGDYRYYLGSTDASLRGAAGESSEGWDAVKENLWLKAGGGVDFAITNRLFLRAEAAYSRQIASDTLKKRYSTGFFNPAYGLQFRIGFGSYIGSAKKDISKKSSPSEPKQTADSAEASPPSKKTAANTPVQPNPPVSSKKTASGGDQIFIGETYKCAFSSKDTFQLYSMKDIPSRYASLSVSTDGNKDTMVAIITIEGAQAVAKRGRIDAIFDEDRYIIALDDDSGAGANAKVSFTIPRERAFIVMVVNKDKSAGYYTLSVEGDAGTQRQTSSNVQIIPGSENTPIIYVNNTYQRTFTSSDSSIHLYGLNGTASYKSITVSTGGNLDTGLLIISNNGAKTLVDTGDPSKIQSKDILGYDTDSGGNYNAKTTITPPKDGACFIIVTSKASGTYTLSVSGN
ncbi:MAG: hypothetical protein LBB48_06485 [Treponema sp.]|jgi:hypothetical protein|nr:hypothetical protein [Treponema sp.]